MGEKTNNNKMGYYMLLEGYKNLNLKTFLQVLKKLKVQKKEVLNNKSSKDDILAILWF